MQDCLTGEAKQEHGSATAAAKLSVDKLTGGARVQMRQNVDGIANLSLVYII